MPYRDYIEAFAILVTAISGLLGWRIIWQDAKNKKLQGDETTSSSNKIQAETVETIISSAGEVINTYKSILETLTTNLNECNVNEAKLEELVATLEAKNKRLEVEIEDRKEDKKRLLDKLARFQTGIGILTEQLKANGFKPEWEIHKEDGNNGRQN